MNSRTRFLWTSFVFLAILALVGCEKFQKETYKMSDYDQKACSILQSEQADTLRPPAVDELNPDWTPDNVLEHAAELADSLRARGIVIAEGEKNHVVVPPAKADTSYLCLTVESEEVTVFLSDVVDVVLIDLQGKVLHAEKTSIPFEVAAECPDILARLTFSVKPGTYLLLFGMNDRTLGKPVHMTVLKGH